MRILNESENISDCDLKVYIYHLDEFIEGFKIRFVVLDIVRVPEWIATPFHMIIYNKGYEFDLKDEIIEMNVDLEANERCSKVMTSPNIGAISIMLPSTPSSQQQPNLSFPCIPNIIHG